MNPPGRPRRGEQRVVPEPKLCEWCGGTYTKPANEPWARWILRRFCSPDCYHDSREG